MTGIVADGDGRLRVNGDLTFDTVPQIDVDGLVDDGTVDVEVSLAEVVRADSAGLAFLLEWTRLARTRDRQVAFVDIPAQLRSLIEVSSAETLLDIRLR